MLLSNGLVALLNAVLALVGGVLGGLLAAYTLTYDGLYLARAQDLADRLLPAFDTPSGLPHANVNLARREGVPNADSPQLVSTAEVSTLQLEFRYLSFLTENDAYWDAAERVGLRCV